MEAVYNEYDFAGAFACASLLAGLAMATLAAKTILERAGRLAAIKGSGA